MGTVSEKKEYVEKCTRNEKVLREALEELKTNHGDGVFGYNAKTFFENVREINDLFKKHKPLFKDSRSTLWEEFQEIIESRKSTFATARYEAESRSHPYRKMIMHELYHADLSSFTNPTIDELKMRSERHRKASQLLSEHKEDMITAHKKEIFDELTRVRKTLDRYWEGYKNESQKKHEDYIARTHRNIAKNQERLQKQYSFLSKLEANLSKNYDQLSDAKGDDFRDTVQGWIRETEDKISDVKQSIAEIEQWIKEFQQKL